MKPVKASAKTASGAGHQPEALLPARRALRASLAQPAESDFAARLLDGLSAGSVRELPLEQLELVCARAFNGELPDTLAAAIDRVETAVTGITRTATSLVLLFNERTGTYTCLNDEKSPAGRPREITQISEGFLQELLGSDAVLYTYLFADDSLMGIVAVANRVDGEPFEVRDEIVLELVAQYLAPKIHALQALKAARSLDLVQETALALSKRFITAVDRETILRTVLEALGPALGFSLCQYIELDPVTGEGTIFLENRDGALESYTHAGLQGKRTVLAEYASLVNLFSSTARREPTLHLPTGMLGEKPLTGVFNLQRVRPQAVRSALIVCLTDPATGRTRGTFNLFRTTDETIAPEVIDIARETVAMAALALSRAAVLEKALTLASTDELTGLNNRRVFYDRFEAEIERARRSGSALCVAMIDVDFFKKLNDTYGHLSGDAVLREIAGLLARSIRKSDAACRFGGEEFVLLFPDTTLSAATDLMERIRARVEQQAIAGASGEEIRATISAGVVPVSLGQPGDAAQKIISEAMAAADTLLYAAKTAGRNRVQVG